VSRLYYKKIFLEYIDNGMRVYGEFDEKCCGVIFSTSSINPILNKVSAIVSELRIAFSNF
jgi:uncharacterized protein (DUF169 family)